MSVLPTQKIEYSDGTNWFQLASENLVNVVAKNPCVVATVGSNLLSTYANGTAGVDATLTNAGTQAVFALDGVTPAVGQRILVKDQTTTFQNGIYTLTNAGSVSTNWVLTRATDYDSPYLINPGNDVVIVSGTVNAITSWVQTATITTVGTSSIIFAALANLGVDSISGTTNQIEITGTAAVPIIAIASNPTLTGNAGVILPIGTAAQRVNTAGTLRFWNGT
jgi:hypothetical protein